MLENPVALYDEEYECLHSNDPTLSEFTMKEDAEVFVPNIITKYQYWHQKGSSQSTFIKLMCLVIEPFISLLRSRTKNGNIGFYCS